MIPTVEMIFVVIIVIMFIIIFINRVMVGISLLSILGSVGLFNCIFDMNRIFE